MSVQTDPFDIEANIARVPVRTRLYTSLHKGARRTPSPEGTQD